MSSFKLGATFLHRILLLKLDKAPSTGLLLQRTRLVTWRGWGVPLEGVGAKLEGVWCDVGGVAQWSF